MRFLILTFLLLIGTITPAFGQANDPEKLVVRVSEKVMDAINQEREEYRKQPETLQAVLSQHLDPVIDFESFSKGVMGKYYDQANDGERLSFVNDFTNTLVTLYARALVAFEVEE